MKSLILMLGLVVSVSAQAKENFYRCNVVANVKGAGYGYQLGMYLSDKRSSTLKVAQTELKLVVNELTKEITGTVNGQPNFKLSGNVENGATFESAFAAGTIDCKSVDLSVALYNNQQGSIYVPKDNAGLSSDLSLTYVEQVKNSCYISKDTKAVAEAVSERLANADVGVAVVGTDVKVVRNERECLESVGSYDDYECVRWSEPTAKVYTLKNCYQPSKDPR